MGAKTHANMLAKGLVPNEAGGKHRRRFLPGRLILDSEENLLGEANA